MELADLVHALTTRARQRPLLTFAVLGTLLFGASRGIEHVSAAPERPAITVRVHAGASEEDVERATDEAVLLAFAAQAGFVHRDAAIRDRIVRNVLFVDESFEPASALAEGMRLDMHQTDPVVRARLLWLARGALASVTRESPSDEQLQMYLRAHPERFRRASALSFEQIFVSRERHADDFDARVRWVSERLEEGLSDPGLLPTRMTRVLPTRVDARFGIGFSEHVSALERDVWSEPIQSVFGVHFVRVSERTLGSLPDLEEIRERVQHDYEHDSRADRLRRALTRMRSGFQIHIEQTS